MFDRQGLFCFVFTILKILVREPLPSPAPAFLALADCDFWSPWQREKRRGVLTEERIVTADLSGSSSIQGRGRESQTGSRDHTEGDRSTEGGNPDN